MTYEQLIAAGVSPEIAKISSSMDQVQYDSFNSYNPNNFNQNATSLSPINIDQLDFMNQGSSNPISQDAFSNGAVAAGFDPSMDLTSGANSSNGMSWNDFSEMLGGAGGIAGAVGGVMGGIGGIMQGVQGIKANKLAQDTFDFKVGAWNENNRLQAQTMNDRMKQTQIEKIHQEGLSDYTARHGDPKKDLANRQYKPLAYGA